MESGTIRFGMFGTARLYAGASLIADVLKRHPGVRVELIGQNSSDVQDHLRRVHALCGEPVAQGVSCTLRLGAGEAEGVVGRSADGGVERERDACDEDPGGEHAPGVTAGEVSEAVEKA